MNPKYETKATLLEQLSTARAENAELMASMAPKAETKVSSGIEATLLGGGAPSNSAKLELAQVLITELLEKNRLASWTQAHKRLFPEAGQYRNFDNRRMVNFFEETMPGSSALLVSGKMSYSAKMPDEQKAKHIAWLKAEMDINALELL